MEVERWEGLRTRGKVEEQGELEGATMEGRHELGGEANGWAPDPLPDS